MALSKTIFPTLSIDRNEVQWENYSYQLTPVEKERGIYWKREDYFAPLGYGGPNGSKLRQCIFLIGKSGARGVVTGASVLSPQISMSALVARHFNMPITIVLGGTHMDSAVKHPNVEIAARAGAEFYFGKVAYNPGIQSNVKKLHESLDYFGYYKLNYGITTPVNATDAEIEEFHRLGAYQVQNIPEEVTHLAMTAGSCNSCVSVLYGLAKYKNNIKKVTLFGIGPTRLDMIEERLEKIERVTGLKIRNRYRRKYYSHYDLEQEHQTDGEVVLEHHDLHHTKYASYGDKMPYRTETINFHPTYEGKALNFIEENPPLFDWYHNPDGTSLFWIVGSEPNKEAIDWTRFTS